MAQVVAGLTAEMERSTSAERIRCADRPVGGVGHCVRGDVRSVLERPRHAPSSVEALKHPPNLVHTPPQGAYPCNIRPGTATQLRPNLSGSVAIQIRKKNEQRSK